MFDLRESQIERITDLNDYNILDALLKVGFDINSNSGHALWLSVCEKNRKLLKYLLERGADPNAGLEKGCFGILYLAFIQNDYRACKLLFEYGAKITNALKIMRVEKNIKWSKKLHKLYETHLAKQTGD